MEPRLQDGIAAPEFSLTAHLHGDPNASAALRPPGPAGAPLRSKLSLGGNVARYSADSTRYGADANIEFRGLLLRGELIGQRRRDRERDDLGWFTLGAFRALPWLQLVVRQEDFWRPSIGPARRIAATTGGANVDLPGGRTRLLVNLDSRTTGHPQVRKNTLIGQLQARF